MAEEHKRRAKDVVEPALRDLFHAGGAMRTEHYELALYDALIGLARELELDATAGLLEQSRREDADALAELEQVAGRLRGGLQ